jgi:hypothetical protein
VCLCVFEAKRPDTLMALPSVGTRVFVPGGGRGRTCCKPIEPPPVSLDTFTVAAGPVTRLVHIEDTALSLRLCRLRRPAEPVACPAPSVLLLHTTPTHSAELTSLHPPPPPLQLPPANLVARLNYSYTSPASTQKQIL